MFDIAMCIVAMLFLIFGTEKIFTYFYKNPNPQRLELLLGALLVFLSSLFVSITAISGTLYGIWVVYSLVVGYGVIFYDFVMSN